MSENENVSQETIDKNKALIEKYPFLLPRYAYSDEIIEDYDYSWTELDAIPDGWRKTYGKLICEDIAKMMGEKAKDFRFIQIKEKFGQLRMYDNGATEEWDIQNMKYEHLTENTCIRCGKIGVPMTDDGWFLPLCKECYEKNAEEKKKYRKIVPKYEDVVCDYGEEGYRFSPTFEVHRYSRDGDEVITVDCGDILERIEEYAQ